MKRAGFTMIELIFVIVILGILAAVAVPKLAATRADAEAAKQISNVATCVGDAGGAYLKDGNFTNITSDDLTAWDAANFADPASLACLDTLTCFTVISNDANGTLSIQPDTTIDTKLCRAAQELAGLRDLNRTTQF